MIALVVQLNLPLPKCNTIQYKESYHSYYQQHSSTQNTRECAGTATPIVILYLWYADGCRIMLTHWARFLIVTGLNRAVPSRSFLPTG